MRHKLKLICREGFRQAGWQRVEVYLNGENCSRRVRDLFLTESIGRDGDGYGVDLPETGEAVFLLSGESASMEDLVEAVAEVLNVPLPCEVTLVDGNTVTEYVHG